jgi:hypothetical protein
MSLRPVLEVLEEWGLHHAEELQEADCKAVIVRPPTFGHCRTGVVGSRPGFCVNQ